MPKYFKTKNNYDMRYRRIVTTSRNNKFMDNRCSCKNCKMVITTTYAKKNIY